MDERSQKYYDAGVSLLSAKLYDQSIACFYYSVLQRMMYSLTIDKKSPIEYDKQNPLNEDIHKRILSDIIQRVNNSNSADKIKDLFLNHLLPTRKKADYEQAELSEAECLDCREWCEALNAILKRYFN